MRVALAEGLDSQERAFGPNGLSAGQSNFILASAVEYGFSSERQSGRIMVTFRCQLGRVAGPRTIASCERA